MNSTIPVGDMLYEFKEKLGSNTEPEVLTLTERNGFVAQSTKFKKRLAVADTKSYKVIRRGDIAFNPYLLWAGAVAHNTDWETGLISPLYPTFRVREGYDSAFVNRLLLTGNMIERYDTIAFGSVPRKRRSSVEDFLALEIPRPPSLLEQKRIAVILDKADDLRVKRRQALAKLDSVAQSIFDTVFGDLREWQNVTFDSLCGGVFRNGVSPSTRGLVQQRVLTLSAVTGHAFDAEASKIGMFDKVTPIEQRVESSSLLICRGNGNLDLVGRGHFPPMDYSDVVFPDTIIAAKPDLSRVTTAFLEHVWNSPYVRSQLQNRARTTNGTFKVNQSMLGEVLIPEPPISRQAEFSDRIAVLDRLRESQRAQLDELDALFSSLQHRAFKGAL